MQGSAREFEIKLEIPAQAAGKVMRLPWLWELASGELNARQLQSVYYDTSRWSLRERGISLRVRRVGAKRVQTLKAVANGAALPIERDEWEEEIKGDEPNLKHAAASVPGLSRKKLLRRLKPCFEIHVDRSAFPVQSANSTIEIAIDRVHVIGDEGASFCEIELELKRGAASEMARIARRIASEVPAALSLKTKADRGYAALQQHAPAPFLGDPVTLNSSTRVGEAFQMIGWTCLRHFALNRDAIEAEEVAAVHQMRRGLERLSASIAAFEELLDGPETDAVRAEIKWLAGELAPVCELDVFLERTLLPLHGTETATAALMALCDEIAMRRQRALYRARQAIASDRYRQMELRTALWLIAAEWSDTGARGLAQPSRRIGAFAAEALTRRAARLFKALKHARPNIEPIAKLNRALAHLSYAVEFFGALFPDATRRCDAYSSLLGALSAEVSTLSDFAAHERLRAMLMAEWATMTPDASTAERAFALGLAIGRQAPEKSAALDRVKKLTRDLGSAPKFW